MEFYAGKYLRGHWEGIGFHYLSTFSIDIMIYLQLLAPPEWMLLVIYLWILRVLFVVVRKGFAK